VAVAQAVSGSPALTTGGSSRRPRSILRSGPVVEIGSLVIGLVLWEVLGRLVHFDWFPPFSACVAALFYMVDQGWILSALADSLQALAVGFTLALVSSLAIAFLEAEFEIVHEAIGAYIFALFLIPSIALVPVFLALFGIGTGTRLALIFVYGFFYMALNFYTAFTQRDVALVEMATSLQASRWQRLRFVVLPAALPLVFATIRVGLGRAVKGMINAEQFIAFYGLGGLVAQMGNSFQADRVFGILIVIVALAFILDIGTRLIDQRMTRWANP
jgi:ABC-type nitrate/sulfonate/bicarbonate transport system permease component